jgi:hypothetical protein
MSVVQGFIFIEFEQDKEYKWQRTYLGSEDALNVERLVEEAVGQIRAARPYSDGMISVGLEEKKSFFSQSIGFSIEVISRVAELGIDLEVCFFNQRSGSPSSSN